MNRDFLMQYGDQETCIYIFKMSTGYFPPPNHTFPPTSHRSFTPLFMFLLLYLSTCMTHKTLWFSCNLAFPFHSKYFLSSSTHSHYLFFSIVFCGLSWPLYIQIIMSFPLRTLQSSQQPVVATWSFGGLIAHLCV